jgi:hypothetical protein
MSANICWEPVSKKVKRLSVGAPSRFMAVLDRLGVSLPGEVGVEHVEVLRGAAAVTDEESNPFQDLIDLIDLYDRVRLWAEY